MKRDDVKRLNDAGEVIIYAFGTRAPGTPAVWLDPAVYGSAPYRPLIVLKDPEGKESKVLCLVSYAHPAQFRSDRTSAEWHSSLPEMIEYTFEDYEARLNMGKRRAPFNPEEAEKFKGLKRVSHFWEVRMVQLGQIRSTFSEYEEDLREAMESARIERERENAVREDRRNRGEILVKKLRKALHDQVSTPFSASNVRSQYDGTLTISLEAAEALAKLGGLS